MGTSLAPHPLSDPARAGAEGTADVGSGTHRRRPAPVYRATAAGDDALAAAKAKVRELFGELFEDEEGPGS